jgi:hypothetical protein
MYFTADNKKVRPWFMCGDAHLEDKTPNAFWTHSARQRARFANLLSVRYPSADSGSRRRVEAVIQVMARDQAANLEAVSPHPGLLPGLRAVEDARPTLCSGRPRQRTAACPFRTERNPPTLCHTPLRPPANPARPPTAQTPRQNKANRIVVRKSPHQPIRHKHLRQQLGKSG